jgi:hypothetical protein
MKHETKVNDIKRSIEATKAANRASNAAKTAAAKLEQSIKGQILPEQLQTAATAAREAESAKNAATAAFAKLPKDRRKMAESAVKMALEIGKSAARQGDYYSGDTSFKSVFGVKASAETSTSRGDQYSRKCTYRKTDAGHLVILDPAGVPCLVESEALRQRSAQDGLYLIALYPDSSAVWVRSKGKAIVSESGWIAGNASVCYHSTESAADAAAGFRRKLALHEREQRLARAAGKIERRARLIARLCGDAVATIADAKRLGYCEPGIAAFQSAHGIGDTATLPQLARTGNPSAVALALSVARKLSARKELA